MKANGTVRYPPSNGYHFLAALTIIVCGLPSLTAFSCGSCKLDECPDPGICRGSLTEDACGCCFQCARVENETCGGQFGLLGRCDEGLICYITPKHGNPITGHESGICKGKYNLSLSCAVLSTVGIKKCRSLNHT